MIRAAHLAVLLLVPGALASAAAAQESRPAQTVEIDGETYGPLTRFKGEQASAFELSSFEGCWFSNSPEFYRQFQRLNLPDPPRSLDVVRYQLEFDGRRTVRKKEDTSIGGYGHLGMFSCEIRAETLISARLLTPAGDRPAD